MFSQEKADAVCDLLAEGKSLRAAAKQCGTSARTVLNWVDANPEFSTQYAGARAKGYALLADELIEISDEEAYEPVPGQAEDDAREVRFDATAVARNRLRVDTRKWMLSKMLPKVYGEKLDVAHSGSVVHLSPGETGLL